MDGFVSLFASIVGGEGIPASAINVRSTTLPGYFLPEKDWDLVVVLDGRLIASVEFKSHIGSVGNNFNNPSTKPWMGYMMLLEEHKNSTRPVKLRQPHFPAFSEFIKASSQRRYKLFCTRLFRERLYDAACLIVSPASSMRSSFSFGTASAASWCPVGGTCPAARVARIDRCERLPRHYPLTLFTISIAALQLSRICAHFFSAIASRVAIQVPPTHATAFSAR
jgi:hypothetical protein